jgi:hypothetical protein
MTECGYVHICENRAGQQQSMMQGKHARDRMIAFGAELESNEQFIGMR